MSEAKRYKCKRCGITSSSAVDFREIIGDLMIPDLGGLVGPNIHNSELIQKEERKRMREGDLPLYFEKGKVRIYSSIFCISCYLEVSHISIDGKNEAGD